MKHIIYILAVVLFCTGCSIIKEARDSDSGITTSDTLEGSNDTAVLNGIVISKNDSGLIVAAADKNSGLGQFEPVSVHYKDTAALDVTMGAIIKISFDGRIAESYPVQIWADQIETLEKVQDNWPPTGSIPEDYPREDAVEDNCYVVGNDKSESEDLMNRFAENTKNGMAGYLRRVMYTIEGDPIISDFIFDGKKYFVFEDTSRDAFAGNGSKLYKKEFDYINTYEKNKEKVIYLADRKDITNEEYEKSMTGSNTDDLPDIYPLTY